MSGKTKSHTSTGADRHLIAEIFRLQKEADRLGYTIHGRLLAEQGGGLLHLRVWREGSLIVYELETRPQREITLGGMLSDCGRHDYRH